MKKIGLISREKIVEEVKERIKESPGCFFVSFNKVGAFTFNQLRNNLRETDAKVLVTKNSLFERALKDLGWQDFNELLEAETSLIYTRDDIVKACKILVDLSKESEGLRLKGGVIRDKRVGSKDITALAKLPSRDILLCMAVASLAAPLSGFINSLNQIILKFVWVIEEIKKTKDKK
jgi:large subunit ribosomal protein L10